MLDLLYNFWYPLFDDLSNTNGMLESNIDFFGNTSVQINEYLAMLCSVISLILIVALCCWCIWKMIKVVAGLFRR